MNEESFGAPTYPFSATTSNIHWDTYSLVETLFNQESIPVNQSAQTRREDLFHSIVSTSVYLPSTIFWIPFNTVSTNGKEKSLILPSHPIIPISLQDTLVNGNDVMSRWKLLCMKHWIACNVGNVLPDSTVSSFWYDLWLCWCRCSCWQIAAILLFNRSTLAGGIVMVIEDNPWSCICDGVWNVTSKGLLEAYTFGE